jgi:pSer/pThr/pTyr-binding forkhead associated (FHA) protein/ribosomal protein L40E
MIVCPNCKHGNPDGATNCEACYTALPATKACPSCGASIQIDATFCGQCGHNLKAATSAPIQLAAPVSLPAEPSSVGLPPTVLTVPVADPVQPNSHLAAEATADTIEQDLTIPPIEVAVEPLPVTTLPSPEVAITPVATQIQVSLRQLLHLQTNTNLEIPPQLQIIHLGKPNDQTPPDIDVSGFPCAEVVSRIHANIRVEEENYYLEDVGSANGTYINHNILPKGNRHLLRIGDRIGLGKGDLVTFIFQ